MQEACKRGARRWRVGERHVFPPGAVRPRPAPCHPPPLPRAAELTAPLLLWHCPQVATFCLALYNLLAGVLGENLVLPTSITQVGAPPRRAAPRRVPSPSPAAWLPGWAEQCSQGGVRA